MRRAVMFDLYETLVTQFDPEWTPPARSVPERLGISDEEFLTHHQRFDDEWETGRIRGYGDMLRAICNEAEREPDKTVIEELERELHQRQAVPFENIEEPVLGMIGRLKSKGLRVGVVTNAGDAGVAAWPGSPLAGKIEHIVASCDAGVLKPDRRIYETALEKLAVRAHEAVFVGDGGSDELAGAAQVGMRPLWATWFVERWWPAGLVPGVGFDGDGWRAAGGPKAPYERVRTPGELVERITAAR